jgi:hypothetical protein
MHHRLSTPYIQVEDSHFMEIIEQFSAGLEIKFTRVRHAR